MRLKNSLILLFAVGLLFFVRCANPVMPTGGPKDTLPPQIRFSYPENNSVNFQGRIVEITFNEFIRLEKINQQALISPPPQENPEYRIKGKTLQVRFKEDLKPLTTYTLFFGNAIVDLTESNPLTDFTFVFSTGPALDSMALRGQVAFAFDDKPAEEAFILLYRLEGDSVPADSLPFLRKPYYVARTNKQGYFRMGNLRNEPYKMYALEDKNSNFLYDKGGEAIAFSDSAVQPEWLKTSVLPKTADTTLQPADSLSSSNARLSAKEINRRDSIAYAERLFADSVRFAQISTHRLRLFNEVDSTQKLLRAELPSAGLLRFAFRYPAQKVEVEPLGEVPDSLHLLRSFNPAMDTLFWYFRDSILDSLHVTVRLDTLINDTLALSLKPKISSSSRRTRQKESLKALAFSSNVSGGKLDIGQPLRLSFAEPVVHYQMRDTNWIIHNGDTLLAQLHFVKDDSIGLRYIFDHPPFAPESDFRIRFPDSVFFGLSGRHNDTVDIRFKVPPLSDYGNFIISISPDVDTPFLIQLWQSKGEMISQRVIAGTKKLTYENLRPGKYTLKAVLDQNKNGRWDTGNLTKGLQPESVFFFEKEVEIRANWDLEEEWKIVSQTDKTNSENAEDSP